MVSIPPLPPSSTGSRCGDPYCPRVANHDAGPCGHCDSLENEDADIEDAKLRKSKIRDHDTVMRVFQLGDHLTDAEVAYLLRRYQAIADAMQGMSEYAASRFHAVCQVLKLTDIVSGRKRHK